MHKYGTSLLIPLKCIHEYLGIGLCSVTGPNWAYVNVSQRTKLVCW